MRVKRDLCRVVCKVIPNVLGLVLPVFLGIPRAEADWLLLLHTEGGGKLTENWEAKVEAEAKFRDNMSEYYDFETMPWAAYRFTDWFKLGAGWRELYGRKNEEVYKPVAGEENKAPIYTPVGDHYWQVEQRPLADFMFTAQPTSWTLEDRVRVEYRCVEDQDEYFRYRNRFRVKPPWSWTRAEIKPWVAWEAYYEDNPDMESGDRLNRHRLYVGLGAKVTRVIKAGCYYYREEVLKDDEWDTNNEIGLEMSLNY